MPTRVDESSSGAPSGMSVRLTDSRQRRSEMVGHLPPPLTRRLLEVLPQPAPPLPEPRGEVTETLFAALRQAPRDLHWVPDVGAASEDDLHLALYCCYELHYLGWSQIDPDWEWEPSVLRVRRLLEHRFEDDLRTGVGPVDTSPENTITELWALAAKRGGPSLSSFACEEATLDQIRELAKHRSAYQLKEADPHTWAIPRISGQAKATMVEIQVDEYGNGNGSRMHSALFAETMTALGLDPRPNRYLNELPGFTLATVNLISFLALHRRLRGALVGHLALFEMTSVGPMGRYSQALRRLGIPLWGRQFYDTHVEADEVHQYLASEIMIADFLRQEPKLAGDVLFGARALGLVEARFAAEVLLQWRCDNSALRIPIETMA
jgi:hypothetical protein